MKPNPLNKGAISENFVGIGTVTPEMVAERARELALIDGRNIGHPSPTDYEEAHRELTGGPELDSKETLLDSLTDIEAEDLTPTSTGHRGFESANEGEGMEGESEGALMYQQGMDEAEHDLRLKAAQAGLRDKSK